MKGLRLRFCAAVLVAAAAVSLVGSSATGQARAGVPQTSAIPSPASPLGGFSARLTFAGTRSGFPACGDNAVVVGTSPVAVEQLAPASGGWAVAPSQGSGARGGVVLLNDRVTGVSGSIDVVNPSTGQSGRLSFNDFYSNGCDKPLPAFVPGGGSVYDGATVVADGCGTIEWSGSGTSFTLTVTFRQDDCEGGSSYLALGDDFSSGEGNPPFDPGAAACNRSARAWPTLFSRQLENTPNTASGWADLGNFACSGATSAALSSSFKGQRAQLDTMRGLDPIIVTLTIGWNDVGFDKLLGTCFATDCVGNGAVAKVSTAISKLSATLPPLYKEIPALTPRHALAVFIVGYPRLLPLKRSATIGCRWLTVREQTALNRLASKFDAVLRKAVRSVGRNPTAYVSTLNTFTRHEMCTRKPWVYRLGRPGGGHPTVKGQQAIATAVRRFFLG